jgi:flagellar hook assembly protein FlgD
VIIDMGGVVRYNSTGFNETAITNVLNQLLATTDTTPEVNIPQERVLISSYPNPFNAGTQIKIDLPRSGETTLIIFNARGENLRTLTQSYLEQGNHTFSWQGKDAQGKDLPAGVYLARIESSGHIATSKLLLLK